MSTARESGNPLRALPSVEQLRRHPLLAELDARAEAERIDEATAKELVLRLRERYLRRELARSAGDLERTRELQAALARIREAVAGLV